MQYGVIFFLLISVVTCTSWSSPFGLPLKQSPIQNLLTERAYEGFERPYNMRRESEIRSGNSISDGLHINLIKFSNLVFNSSEYRVLKNISHKTLSGRMIEKLYEQKLRQQLKKYKHNRPIYVLGHEALNNSFIKISNYMSHTELYNLNQHYILFLTEKPIVNSPNIVSLPVSKIIMSLYNSETMENLPTEAVERRMNSISRLSLKNLDRILTQDLSNELSGKLPKSIQMEIEFTTLADSEGAREYFTIDKNLYFSKTCRFLF